MRIRKAYSKHARRDVYTFDFEYKGKRYRRSKFHTRKLCEDAALALREKLQRQAYGLEPSTGSRATLKDLVARRLAQPGDARQHAKRENYFKRFSAMLPSGVRVEQITTQDYAAYFESRTKTVKPQTAFRELTEIVSLVNRARDFFPTLENWQPPRRPNVGRIPSGQRERIITTDEAARLLAHMRRPRDFGESLQTYRVRLTAADLLQVALQTAARRAEILSLRWTDINFEWRTLRIVGTKTDRIRVIPLTDSLITLFRRRQAAQEAAPSPFAFPRGGDERDKPHTTINDNLVFKEASRELDIPYGRDTAGGWVLHDARHTAITAMLHAGASIESVMSISGHHARVMMMRYAHATERTRREAINALENFVGFLSADVAGVDKTDNMDNARHGKKSA
jgi:integrase